MQKNFKCCLLAAMFLATTVASAQVTVGSGKVPADFSVLELINNDTRGLRLPQMTTAQRNRMEEETFGDKKTNEAMGLQIFNTDTRCVETWNGTTWIGACAPVHCADLPATVTLCSTSTPTIADLNNEVGAAVSWYAADTGGEPLASTYELIVGVQTLYAGNCSDQDTRRSVTVSLNCSAITPDNARMAAFTNVMYDFQHQEFEAYVTTGGQPTTFEWFVVKDGVETKITGAPNAAKFTVPADFMYQYGDYPKTPAPALPVPAAQASVELTLRCKMTNPKTTIPVVSNFAVLFIRTNTAGYKTADNGDRYLEINNGGGGGFKVALLNLGASANDGIGLGDFYQWGRVADGHEKIGWCKRTDVPTTDAKYKENWFVSGENGTSAAVTKGTVSVDAAGQILASDADHYQNFIMMTSTVSPDWSTNAVNANRWGNGSGYTNRTTDIAPSSWAHTSNNVCAGLGIDWGVPSRWNFWDMYRGTGSDTKIESSMYIGTVNTWLWRPMANDTQAAGGAIITNPNTGEKLYFPAAGYRLYNSGSGAPDSGTRGLYWSSTYYGTGVAKDGYCLSVNRTAGTGVGAGNNIYFRSYGMSVRCVSEF